MSRWVSASGRRLLDSACTAASPAETRASRRSEDAIGSPHAVYALGKPVRFRLGSRGSGREQLVDGHGRRRSPVRDRDVRVAHPRSESGDQQRLREQGGSDRGGLVATQLLGLAMTRYVWRLEPIASLPDEDVVACLAPTIQRYLTGELRPGY